MKKAYILLIISVLCFSVNLAGQNLSVNKRWNIKTSYSLYKTHNADYPLIEIGKYGTEMIYLKKSNVRIELNYGVLKWLEVGGYFGLMSYKSINMKDFHSGEIHILGALDETAIIPTFGVNANVHILPFFVKNEKCKWDFYIPVRYGGFYLTKWGEWRGEEYGVLVPELGTWDEVKNGAPKWNKYRHEYGAGLGGAVYIKNIIGFYIEALGGQFSYAPEMFKSPYAIRVGITAKF